MAMQKSKRQELRKLRELVRFLIADTKCFFCKKALVPAGRLEIGEADGAPVTSKITIHHVNGDHDDNRRCNHRLAHTSCHKSYHMRQAWKTGQFWRAA